MEGFAITLSRDAYDGNDICCAPCPPFFCFASVSF